jgi:hypothetical protein
MNPTSRPKITARLAIPKLSLGVSSAISLQGIKQHGTHKQRHTQEKNRRLLGDAGLVLKANAVMPES